MLYELCSIPGVQVVTGGRAKALIPKGEFKAYAGQCPAIGATVFLPLFKENGRYCLGAYYGFPDGSCSWVLVASARRKATAEKARAVALAWYAGQAAGKGAWNEGV